MLHTDTLMLLNLMKIMIEKSHRKVVLWRTRTSTDVEALPEDA